MDNNLLKKLNNGDIYLVNSRFLKKYDDDISKNYFTNNDFIKYKKQIKDEVNKIYKSYCDISNIEIKKTNENDAYLHHFNMFVKKFIKKLKLEEKNLEIQNELNKYSNTLDISYNCDISKNYDISNNYTSLLDKRIFNLDNNKTNRNNNKLNEFIKITKNNNNNNKILPKKRN
tara:strand:- start:33592 stop:34110 length:519 start_codon:yes stop_codon:yes gene_type:complete